MVIKKSSHVTRTGRHDSSRQFATSMGRPRKTSRKDAPKAANLKKKLVVEVDKVQDSPQPKDGHLSTAETAETSSKPGETHFKKRILTKAQMKAYPKANSPSPEASEPDSEDDEEEGGPQGAIEEEPVSPAGPSPPPESMHQEPERPKPTDAGKKSRGRHIQTYTFSDEQEAELAEWFGGQPMFYNRKLKLYKDSAKKERVMGDKAASLDPPATCKYKVDK